MAWAPDYCSAADLKAYVRVADDLDDAQVTLAVSAASRAIDKACGRQFGKVDAAESRYYTAVRDRSRRRWVIDIDDLSTLDGVTVKFDGDDDGTYGDLIDEVQAKPVNAAVLGLPFTQLVVHPNSTTQPTGREDAVEVRGAFGWPAVPVAIKQATLLQASRLLWRRDAPAGVSGSPDGPGEVRLLAKVDPDVAVLVRPFYRWWGAA